MGPAEQLAKELANYQCGSEKEAFDKSEMIESLNAGIYNSRDNPEHFTASAFVVAENHILLMKHLKIGKWVQPGGHIEDGEYPLQAAIRECIEETGITPAPVTSEPVHIDIHTVSENHHHLDIRYLMTATKSRPNPPPEESQDVAWVHFDDVRHLSDSTFDEALVRLLARAETGDRWDFKKAVRPNWSDARRPS